MGHPATTFVRIIKRAEELDLSWPKVNSMTRAAVLQAFEPPRRQVLNYTEPDWESIYLQHERKTKPLTLQILWEDYSKTVPESEKILSPIEERMGFSATVVAGQVAPEEWYDFIGDSVNADALLDRLLNRG